MTLPHSFIVYLQVTLNKDYHVLKGVSYKEGKVPSMMISSASKQNWEEKTESTAPSSKAIATGSKIAAVATNSSTETNKVGSDATSQRPQADSTDAKLSAVNDAKGAKKSEKVELSGYQYFFTTLVFQIQYLPYTLVKYKSCRYIFFLYVFA